MELPKRAKGDRFTKPGEYPALRQRLRTIAAGLNIPTVVTYAFDKRTRLVPYFFTSHYMAPAGARAVASALYDSGLTSVRTVLQQWNPNFRPSRARLDGEPPEMLLVSSMQIHAESAYDLIGDAGQGDPADRPLIIAGGPKAIYEPWDLFEIRGNPNVNADVVVTGEEFVLCQLLEVLLAYRARHGDMREAFRLARRDRALEGIPGLVYRQDDSHDAPLLTTGIQRLVQDLDELPHPIIGYGLLERPHRRRTLKARPLPLSRVWLHSQLGSLSMTHGCKFNCDYCPIPAYNQRTFRHKSPERLVDEMRQLRLQAGIRYFFGTDDNFFNDRATAEEIFAVMSGAMIGRKPLKKMVRWGTEATAYDTWKNRDLLRDGRRSGLRALWIGVEDLTATLIKKGQSVDRTAELFAVLNKLGITPMPMLMHHDGQPLRTPGKPYGLLDQVRYLRKIGAHSVQVTVLTPAPGTRAYEANFERGEVFDTVGGRKVLEWQVDGNHVVASSLDKPWQTQVNVLLAYLAYYNPLNLVRSIVRPSNSLAAAGAFYQVIGMVGLANTVIHSARWAHQVWRGPITRRAAPSMPKAPMIEVGPHAESPGPPSATHAPRQPQLVQLGTDPEPSAS